MTDLITTKQAALLAKATPDAVRKWVARDKLRVVQRDHRGHPLYRPSDVLEAERSTRLTPQGRKRSTLAA